MVQRVNDGDGIEEFGDLGRRVRFCPEELGDGEFEEGEGSLTALVQWY